LHAAWVAGGYSPAEKRTGIRIRDGDPDVRMIHDVERFRPKLDSLALPDYEFPVQSAIHDGVAWAWQDVAACVSESEGRGRRERIYVEELIDAALAGRFRLTPGTTFGRLGVPELA
jgi:hypothetical protein